MSPRSNAPPRVPEGSTKSHKSRKHKSHHGKASSDRKDFEQPPSVTATSASEINVNSTTSSWDYPAPTSWGNTSITTASEARHDTSDETLNADPMLDYRRTMAYDLIGIGTWIPAGPLVDSTSLDGHVVNEHNVSVYYSFEKEDNQAQIGYWTTGSSREAEDLHAGVVETHDGEDTMVQR